jgi:predicted metal-binding membrane protein
MTTATPSLRRLTPHAAVLFLLAAVAWLITLGPAGSMRGMTGTMGLSLPGFVGMWTLMMAAMMLPSVSPVASMYQRSVTSHRAWRLAGFTFGYLLAWAGAGIPAYLLTLATSELVSDHPGWATPVAVAVFAACGVYQLTPLKTRCLKHCRSPLSLLLHYGSYRGPLRDIRAGAHHGAYCLGCCWSLMALFVVLGVMNVVAMVVLAVVVLVEKLWVRGEDFSRAVGVVSLALAVAVIWIPELAPGLQGADQTDQMDQMMRFAGLSR